MPAYAISSGNKHIVCQYIQTISNFGTFISRNPLDYTVPLFLMQLSIISLTCQALEFCLQPLGQSSIVAQILGGVLYGPSVLGHKIALGRFLFPARSFVTLETAAVFGLMFFFFAIGVRSDTRMMVRPDRQAMSIGLSAMFITLSCTISFSMLLKTYVRMDATLASALPYIAASQGITAFPNIACLLGELNMSTSHLGRIATSSSMLCDMLGIALTAIMLGVQQSKSDPVKSGLSVVSAVAFILGMAFLVGPVVRWVMKTVPTEKALADHYVVFCFTGTLLTGLITELIGQHFILGPLIFGLLFPDEQPLGAPIITKLDYPIGKILYPTFLTTSGLKTNFFKINLWSLWIVVLLMIIALVSKVGAVAFASRFFNINFQESIVIGLMMNARGVCELIMYNLMRDGGILTDQEFALSVLTVVGVTIIITPLIKLLYDPSAANIPLRRRTIQHLKHDAEFRILVCIKNQESVPSIINLLEASHPVEESPISVIAILLIELVGRATPMLVAHQATRSLQPSNSRSGHIINALRQYELCHENCVTVQSFSAISHLNMFHDDICRVALDQNANLVILPFHKQWEIDGSIGVQNRALRNMNIKVMDKSPCSIALLVDRGILTGSLSILNNQSIYRVAVIYIGGADDAESLSYGARMARHNNVTLTIIRFLLFGCDTARERKQDNIMIDEVRQANVENPNFTYQEHVVKDGVGLAAALRSLDNVFDMLIVGRHHQSSQILVGLDDWSECPELGVVGDILASPDCGSTASVLVVQQQKMHGDKMKNRTTKPVVISHESAHEMSLNVPAATAAPANTVDNDPRWEISIERDRP